MIFFYIKHIKNSIVSGKARRDSCDCHNTSNPTPDPGFRLYKKILQDKRVASCSQTKNGGQKARATVNLYVAATSCLALLH